MSDVFTFRSSALPDDARVVSFQGRDALSRPYRFEIHVTVPDVTAVDRADAISAKATLSIDRGDDGPLAFHGVVSSLSLVHTQGQAGVFRVAVVPRLWLLSRGRHSRIFTKKTIIEVMEEILQDEGLTGDDYELKLQGTYEAEEFICQYQESSLDFLHRWMELEGIYYFFEQGEWAEKLIITDSRSFHDDIAPGPVRYSSGGHTGKLTAAVESFTSRTRSLPRGLRLLDYDYAHPQLDVSARADVSPTGTGEMCIHSARFFSPDEAKRMAQIRAEELVCRESQHYATGSSFLLRAGYTFELDEHPVSKLNKKYLVTEAVYTGRLSGTSDELRRVLGIDGTDVYSVRASAIDAATQFRPRRVTPWPRVHGYELGVVDGPATSEYAQIDDQGRYLVKLHFDESTLTDGKASTYVRMLQPHGGGVEGWHFPLRRGTEVLFLFLNGDPDRPVIAGVVPNAHTPSPVTSSNHTTNVIQTGGRNRLEMEDLDGSQRFTFSTPVETSMLRLGAPNDDCNARLISCGVGRLQEGANFTMITHGAKREEAKNVIDEQLRGAFKTTVTNKTTERYNATKLEEVFGDLEQTYKTSHKTTVTGHVEEIYNGKHKTTVKGARVETLDAEVRQNYDATLATTVTNKVTDTYSGGYNLSVSGTMTHTVSGKVTRQANNIDDQVLLNFEYKGADAKVTIGVASETYGGMKMENLVGGKVELINFVIFEATAAILVDVGTAHCDFTPAHLEDSGVSVADGSGESENGGAEVNNTAVSVEKATVDSKA
jgi:type VI secretion system secreted protein VgrG